MKTKIIAVALIFISIISCREEEIIPPESGPGDAPITEWMQVRVKFELTVGGILYPNTDAEFIVKAYDKLDAEQWNKTFIYNGPQANDLTIKAGFDHYRVEAKVWRISVERIFNGDDLWTWRVLDGFVPLTRVFAESIEPKRVVSYIRSRQETVNGTKVMVPESKTTFEYDDNNKVDKINYAIFNDSIAAFIPSRQSKFNYGSSGVSTIVTHEPDIHAPVSQDFYTYEASGRVTHIQHKESGITTDVQIAYSENDRLIKAAYSHSNGRSFEYEFLKDRGNLTSDHTSIGDQWCNTGAYAYDRNINPLKHLGYMDFLFRNYSISNRTVEHISYNGCAIPTLIPETYSYTYDEDGYPLVVTTHYKGSGFKSKLEYTYE